MTDGRGKGSISAINASPALIALMGARNWTASPDAAARRRDGKMDLGGRVKGKVVGYIGAPAGAF